MPKTLLQWLGAIALVASSVLCSALTIVALDADRAVRHVDPQITTVAGKVAAAVDSANGLLGNASWEVGMLDKKLDSAQSLIDDVDRQVNAFGKKMDAGSAQVATWGPKVSANLDETHRLILEAGLTAMEARKASAEERAALPGLTAQASQIASTASTAIGTMNQTMKDTQPVIANLQTTTAALSVIVVDGKDVVEKYAHPSKKKLGFWGTVFAVGRVIQKLSPPLF